MFRIACKFEPQHPRMAGKCGSTQLFTRGAWRVLETYKAAITDNFANEIGVRSGSGDDRLWIPCLRRKAPPVGTLINPRKVVNEFLAQRRELRA